MKKLSHLTILSAAFLALTSYGPAQQQLDPLVQIVRNATQQYQNVANAGPDYALPSAALAALTTARWASTT